MRPRCGGLASLLLPLLGSAVLGELRSSKDPPLPPAYPIGHVDEPFAKAVGRIFEVNGTARYLTGTNAWYLNRLDEGDLEITLKQILDSGYTIIRVWAFGEINRLPNPKEAEPAPMSVYFHYLNETGGYINYGSSGLDRFDRLVSRCESLGLKLVLPLFNYWGDYGGLPLYMSTYSEMWEDEWYDVPAAQEVYRDYVKVIVERYKDSPAVFAWQLGNEPRCEGCGPEGVDRLIEWAGEISRYIKELDPGHMVSMGDEGWLTPREREAGYGDDGNGYSGMNGVDWVRIMGIETLDYGTVHLWPDHWAYPYEWGVQWIEDHDNLAAKFNKPVILEEYGAAARNAHIAPLLPWQDALVRSGFAADQTWQFEPDGTSFTAFPDPQFSIHYGSEEWLVLAKNHSRRIGAKSASLGTGGGGMAVAVQYEEFV